MSRHRPPVAAPLLSFPPTSSLPFSSSSSPRHAPEAPPPGPVRRRKHVLIRACLMTPLVFITLLYAFAAYAYFFSLVVDFLWIERRQAVKASIYGLVFLWLEGNAFFAVWHCWYRGGGNIGAGSGHDRAREHLDEEEAIGAGGANGAPPMWNMLEEVQGLIDGEEGLTINRATTPNRTLRNSPVVVGQSKTTAMRELSDLARAGGMATTQGDVSMMTGGVQVKSDGTARWCRKCRIPKPDRAHHCSSCGTCVLKMDHHCPWLGGGCVGWANYKFFLLFLLYSGALGIWVAVTTMIELVHFVALDEQNFELAPVVWALIFFVGLIFGISVSLFGLYHLYLACRNRTTIESMEPPASIVPSTSRPAHYRVEDHALSREDRRALEKAQSKLNIYDLGWKENLKQVMGEDWRSWFVPLGGPPGDGYSFPINQEQLNRLREITTAIRSGDAAAARCMRESSGEFADDENDDEDEDDEDEAGSDRSSETGRRIRRA